MNRHRGAIVGGVVTLSIAWPLGSLPLAIGGLGVLVAAFLAWIWERRVRSRLAVRRSMSTRTLFEGDDLHYELQLAGARLPGNYVLDERLGSLPVTAVELRRSRTTEVVVRDVPRGRLRFGRTRLTADDPLGIARVTVDVEEGTSVLVRPRVPVLRSLFTDSGARFGAGDRGAVTGPTGLDLRGVREYREGEPLRSVHWVSTARRGRLMVRELEEPPRHDATVLLDLDQAAETGPPGRTSLDEAARVAGALVRAQLVRGRTVRLVVAGAGRDTVLARSLNDWDGVLDVLAAAEPRVGGDPLGHVPGEARATGRTVFVTARHDALASPAGDVGAVVFVDAPTYAGRPRSQATPWLLSLAAHGVPVAVVRCGDDLCSALEGVFATEAVVG